MTITDGKTMSPVKNEYLPLTQMQQGIFVDSSAAAARDPYVIQVMIEMAAALDYERLLCAVNRVANSHSALRTCFRARTSGEPVQVVVPAVAVAGRHDDLRAVEPDELAAVLEQIVQDDFTDRFDLAHPPLLRVRAIDVAGGRQHVLISFHHIVLDGWSVPGLVREMLAVYAGAAPNPEFVFRDYLAWESAADVGAARAAFGRVLHGLANPIMIAEPIVDGEAGQRSIGSDLQPGETDDLATWCRRREASLASVVEACWAQTVALQTGCADVVIGVMEANRSHGLAGVDTAVGLFANVVPVRVDLRGDATLAEICATLTVQRLETLPHRHLGVGRLQASRGGDPLFDTIVTFQNYRSGDALDVGIEDADDLRILSAKSSARTTQPAMLTVVPGAALHIELTYRTEAVSPARAQSMLDTFTDLLRRVPAGGDESFGEWSLFAAIDASAASERDDDVAGPAMGATPVAPLLRMAARSRHRPALTTAAGTLNYGELFDAAAAVSGSDLAGAGPSETVIRRLAAALDATAPAAAARAIDAYRCEVGLSGDDTVLTASPRSMLITAALAAGAHVVLYGDADGSNLASAMRDRDVTVIEGSASALGRVARVNPAALGDRRVIVTGPPLTRATAGAVMAAGARLWLAYTRRDELLYLGAVDGTRSAPTIGPSGKGAELGVVDPHGRVVPAGSVGQIAFGGGAVRWTTGDLGRQGPDGRIEYLGPVEPQLAIRGKRIQPWSIEQVITSVPGVAEAAVIVTGHLGGAAPIALVAHVSPASVDTEAVSATMRRRLPAYAVPSRIEAWPQLPRTARGDVDLDALIDHHGADASVSAEVARLVCLYTEITGAESVGPHSDFFALGGDSISVTRLRARAMADHGWDLKLSVIFEHRTPAAVVREAGLGKDPGAAAPPVPQVEADRPLPRRAARSGRTGRLLGTQASLWLLNQVDPASSGYNLAVAMDVEGALDEPALAAAMADVVERHEVLRTTYRLQDGVPTQRVEAHDATRGLLLVADCTAENLDGVLAASARRGFLLGVEWPMRAELYRTAPDRATVLLVFHHVAMDGTSFLPFAQDLETAYRARAQGRSPHLDDHPVQYLDYAAWLSDRLGSAEDPATPAARQAAFWQAHLHGLPDRTGIPVEPVLRGAGSRAQRLILRWDPVVQDAVGRIADRAGATRFAVYQTALAAAMHSLGAPAELALGSPVSVRPHANLADAVGNYANFLASRIRLDLDLSLVANVRTRRRTLARELDHQELPFNEVVRAVHPSRQAGQNPIYQTALALQNFVKPRAALSGVMVTERILPVVDARLDLVVAVVEGEPGDGVTVSIEFAEGAYLASTMRMLAERLCEILQAGADAPDRPLRRHVDGLGVAQAPGGSTVTAEALATDAPTAGDSALTSGNSERVLPDDLLAQVLAAYRTSIRFNDVDPDVGYFDAGGDSVGTVSVAAALARHHVDVATLMTGPSARALTTRIAAGEFQPAGGGAESIFAGVAAAGYDVSLREPFSTILPIRPAGTQRPLFAFHGGVGLSIPYTGLSTVIDKDVPIYGLQSTETIFGADPAETMTTQVRTYVDRIREVQPNGPYRLLGWSYGGWAAHEATHILEQEGDEVELLVIIDSEITLDSGRAWGPSLPRQLAVSAFTNALGITRADGSAVSTDEQLYAAFQRIDGAFARLSPDEVSRFIDVMEHHARLVHGHRPGQVSAPTVLFWSASNGTRHPADLADDWSPYLTGPVTSLSVEAQHQFLMHPLPQRLIGTMVNTLMQDPGRAQLLTEPRYREEPELTNFLADPPNPDLDPVSDPEARSDVGHLIEVEVGMGAPAPMGPAHRLWVETRTLVWRRLHQLRKTPWRLIAVAINPLILIIALGYLFAHAIVIPGFGGTYMKYLLAGVSAQAALQNIGPSAIAIRADLDKGLFDRFRSLPMGRGVVLFAHSVADSIIGVAGLLVVVVGGYIAGWRLSTNVFGFAFGLAVLVLFTYVCVWIGIGVGLLVKSLESIESIGVLLSVGLSFLSNALLAPGSLPKWLQAFAEWNPVSAVATAVRKAWGNPTAQSASVAGRFPLVILGVFSALVLVVIPVFAQRRYRKGN